MRRYLPIIATIAFALTGTMTPTAGAAFQDAHSATLISGTSPNRTGPPPAAPNTTAAGDDLPFPRNYKLTPSCREFVTFGTVNGQPARVQDACERINPPPAPAR